MPPTPQPTPTVMTRLWTVEGTTVFAVPTRTPVAQCLTRAIATALVSEHNATLTANEGSPS